MPVSLGLTWALLTGLLRDALSWVVSCADAVWPEARCVRACGRGSFTETLRAVAAMQGCGVPLSRSFALVAREIENPSMARAIEDAAAGVGRGESLASAMRRHPWVFDEVLVALVGETTTPDEVRWVLERYADHRDREARLESEIVASFRYPAIMLTISLVVVAALLALVMPSLKPVMGQADLPPVTAVALWLSDQLSSRWHLIVLAMLFLVRAAVTRGGRWLGGECIRRLPVLGPVIRSADQARLVGTLTLLAAGGVGLRRAWRLAVSLYGPGRTCTRQLLPVLTALSSAGRGVDRAEVARRLAGIHDARVGDATRRLVGVIEPLVITFMGVVIGAIILAVYLPHQGCLIHVG